MLYFPYLYPDELLGSVVARYHAHTMSPSYNNTLTELFGKRSVHQNVELPCLLTVFEENTHHLLKMTARDVAWKTTMLPYYSSYLDEAALERITEMMSNGPRRNPMSVLGAHLQRTPPPYELRTCSQCILEDMKRYGETYWRRSHQLRAVHFCVRHKRPLLASQFSCRTKSRQVESASADMMLSEYLPFLTAVESARLFRISTILTSFLQRGPGDKPQILTSELNTALRRSKYWTGKYTDYKSLAADMTKFFGSTVLNLLNLTTNPLDGNCWTRTTFNRKPNGGTPIRYALFKLFFESKVTHRLSRGSGPWLCQNPMAEHYGQPTMTVSRTLGSGRRVFECSCGLVFIEKHSEGAVDCQPERKLTVRISESDANKIRERYAAGIHQRKLSKDFKVSRRFILVLLGKLEYKKRPDPTAARRAWDKTQADRKAAERALLGGSSKSAKRTDESNLAEIQQAVEHLKMVSPPVRITRTSIRAHLGWDLFKLLLPAEVFPKTIAYLDAAVETSDQCRVRAVSWHIRNWPDDRPIARSELLHRASVRQKHPEAMAECDRLLSGLRRRLAD